MKKSLLITIGILFVVTVLCGCNHKDTKKSDVTPTAIQNTENSATQDADKDINTNELTDNNKTLMLSQTPLRIKSTVKITTVKTTIKVTATIKTRQLLPHLMNIMKLRLTFLNWNKVIV